MKSKGIVISVQTLGLCIKRLDTAQCGSLLQAIYEYAETGNKQESDDPILSFAMEIAINEIAENLDKYERKCEKNSANVRKRWNTDVSEQKPSNTTECERIRTNTTVYDGNFGNTNGYEENSSYGNKKEIEIKNKNKKEKENKEKEIRPADGTLASLGMIIQKNVEPEKVQKALLEFVKMRRILKKPLTDHALELAIDHLKTLTQDPVEQEAIVNQSIQNGWQGLFPLKPTGTVTRVQPQRQTKVVVEQQYDQRTNNENSGSDIPEFLKKYGSMLKEG